MSQSTIATQVAAQVAASRISNGQLSLFVAVAAAVAMKTSSVHGKTW
jgi:thiamine phosphate synthase YjbQ (UPF0047 family)